MGVNVDYAPVLDLATNPANPALGIRSFGDDPAAVARLGAAIVRGLQGAGVAATVKHFPGRGECASDTHHGLGVVDADRADLEARRARARSGRRSRRAPGSSCPATSRCPRSPASASLPATLSRAVMHDLLRDELGFDGVIDHRRARHAGARPGRAQAVDVVAALRAGVDLLLCDGRIAPRCSGSRTRWSTP